MVFYKNYNKLFIYLIVEQFSMILCKICKLLINIFVINYKYYLNKLT